MLSTIPFRAISLVMLQKKCIFAEKINDMKKLIYLIILCGLVMGCCKKKDTIQNPRRLVMVVIHNYTKADEPYRCYGIYKEVDRRFNYTYHDSTWHSITYIDWEWGEDYYTNEYGDTVFIRYYDYTNYPRRED